MPVLTVAAVRSIGATPKRREIPDARAPGLYLVIQPKPSGAKSWALRFRRPDGRPAKLTLGPVDLRRHAKRKTSRSLAAPSLLGKRVNWPRRSSANAKGASTSSRNIRLRRHAKAPLPSTAPPTPSAPAHASSSSTTGPSRKVANAVGATTAALLGLRYRSGCRSGDRRAASDQGWPGRHLGPQAGGRNRRPRRARRRQRGQPASRLPSQRGPANARTPDARRAVRSVLVVAARAAQDHDEPVRWRVAPEPPPTASAS